MQFSAQLEYTKGNQPLVVIRLGGMLKMVLTAKEASGLVKLLKFALSKIATPPDNGDYQSGENQTRI